MHRARGPAASYSPLTAMKTPVCLLLALCALSACTTTHSTQPGSLATYRLNRLGEKKTATVTLASGERLRAEHARVEGDTLRSRLELELREPLAGGGGLVHLRSFVSGDEGDVLDPEAVREDVRNRHVSPEAAGTHSPPMSIP